MLHEQGGRYVELRARTAFSFGDGAVAPDRLIQRAVELGYSGIGIVDSADMGSVVRARVEAEKQGIHLVVGAELIVDGYPLAFLVRDRIGCHNLAALVTASRVGDLGRWSKDSRGPGRGSPAVSWSQVVQHNEGLHLLTGSASGALAQLVLRNKHEQAVQLVSKFWSVFGGRMAVEVQNHLTGGQERVLASDLIHIAEDLDVPWVVTNEPRYIDRDSKLVHDILTALRYGLTLEEAARRGVLHPNSTWRLRSPEEMAELWRSRPEGLYESVRIAEECEFQIGWLRPPLPEFDSGEDIPVEDFLRKQVYAGAVKRWERVEDHHRKQIEHELAVIGRLGFAGFFLVMWDAVRYAREELGLLCQGRGSAANSVVAYCLEITAVDPVRNKLLFERFLSDVRLPEQEEIKYETSYERKRSRRHGGHVFQEVRHTEAPDIDVDIEHDQREKVIDYIYEKYERKGAAITCIVQTYGAPNALLDSMRALGYPPDLGFRLSRRVHRYDPQKGAEVIESSLAEQFGLDLGSPRGQALLRAMKAFQGLPRLRSTHVGGFVLSKDRIGHYLPVEHSAMGRTIIQFDKDDLDIIGVPKFDFLGLGALSMLKHAFREIYRRTGKELALYSLPDNDRSTFEMIARGDTLGTFQIESRAQISSILKTKPEKMYDIVVQIALVRPGPIQGEFVHPYTQRRRGREKITYRHPALESILARTQGIPIFQEQAMKISVELGGFSAAQADNLRRTIGNKKKEEKLAGVLEELKLAMINNKSLDEPVTPEVADQICSDLLTFANFGFPESHSWSFAYIAYATAYLKCHYPADFYLGLLNAQPMGFYPVSTLIHDAVRSGLTVLPPCIREGDVLCTTLPPISHPRLRIGWKFIKGISDLALEKLIRARQTAPFTSIADVVQRVVLKRSEILQIARSGAFGAWEQDRRKAAWIALGAVGDRYSLAPVHKSSYEPRPLTESETTFLDYEATGLCISGHPVQYLREKLGRVGAIDSSRLKQLKGGESVTVGGLVTVRQRPATAKGTIFLLLEDEFGLLNVIVPPHIVDQYREVVRFAPFVVVKGKLERSEEVMNVVAERVIYFSAGRELAHSARSFK